MFGWFSKERPAREREQLLKLAEGHRALTRAVVSTSEAAESVARQLRQRLDDSIRQYESTIKILADALLVADEMGKIEGYNPAATQMFGFDRLSEMHLTDLFVAAEHHKRLDIKEFWSLIEQAQNGDGFKERRQRVRGRRSDQETFYCDVTISTLVRSTGQAVVVLLVRDISTQILVKEQLAGTIDRYQRLFDHAYDGIVVIQDNIIRAANPSITRITGLSREQMIGRSVFEFLHPDEHDAYRERLRLRTETLLPYTVEQVIRINGLHSEPITVEMRSSMTEWNDQPANLVILRERLH